MPNPFDSIKTLSEELAAEQNLDALTPEEAAQLQPPTGNERLGDGQPMSGLSAARARHGGTVEGAFQAPLPNQGNHKAENLTEKDLALAGGQAAQKVAQADAANPDRFTQANLTPDEQKGQAFLQKSAADVSAANDKAAAESSVPTALKLPVAAAKGVASAVENTAALAGVHPAVEGFKDQIPSVGGATGALVEGVSQFAVGMKATGLILGTGGGIAGSMGRGAVTDFSVFDAHAGRLSDLLVQHPSLRNPVTEFFASNPDDSEAVSRLKNALEGLGLGAATEGFTKAIVGTSKVFLTKAAKGEKAAAKEASKLFEEHAAHEAEDVAKPRGERALLIGEKGATPASGAIRPASPEDAAATSWESVSKKANPEGKPGVAQEDNVMDDTRHLFVARDDSGNPIGVLELLDPAEFSGNTGRKVSYDATMNIAVDPAHRRKGVGTQLIEAAKKAGYDVEAYSNSKANVQSPEGAAFKKARAAKVVEAPKTPVNAAVAAPVAKPVSPVEAIAQSVKNAEDASPVWNHERIVASDEMRQTLEQYGREAKAVTDDGVQHLVDAERLRDDLGLDTFDFNEGVAGVAKNIEHQNAVIQGARVQMNKLAKAMLVEGRKLQQGVSTDPTALNNLRANLQNLMIALVPARKAQARGLGQWRLITNDNFSLQQIQDIIAAGGDPGKLRRLGEASIAAKTFDSYMQLRVNALMSSPATHSRNLLSNAFNSVLKPATRLIGSVGDRAAMAEALSSYAGLIHGFMESAKMAKMAWDLEAPILKGGSELGSHRAISSANYGLEPNSLLGYAVDAFGKLSNTAGRGLGASDEFFSQLNYRANKYATLTREGILKGEKDLAAFVKKGMDEAFDPLAVPGKGVIQGRGNDETALQYALEATFQEKPGYLTSAALASANKLPVIRSFVPFMKTIGNITRQGAEYSSPVGALASTHWWSDIQAGGMKRREAVGKLVVGTGVTVTTGLAVHNGLITGEGPSDYKLRQELMVTGWRPYSFKVGDTYRSYRGFIEPLGTGIAMIANFFERSGGWSEDKKASYASQVVTSITDSMLSQTFAQGISQMIDSIDEPTKLDSYMRAWTASHVPALMNDARESRDPIRRKAETVGEALANRGLGDSTDVPAMYDALGNKKLLDYGIGPEAASPITGPFLGLTESQRKGNPVLEEIARLNIVVGSVPRNIKLNDQFIDLAKITNEKGVSAYDRWNELIKDSGLEKELADTIKSPEYQDLPDEVRPGYRSARQNEIAKIIEGYRQEAKGQLFEEFKALGDAQEAAASNRNAFFEGGSKGLKPLIVQPKQ